MEIPIAIIGCGGMGRRHLLGIQELQSTSFCNVELVAVCDLRMDNAAFLAEEAGRLLGSTPAVYQDLEKMALAIPDLQAVIITTEAGSHHRVASTALELGLNVLCEKPLALTVRGCNRILQAQNRSTGRAQDPLPNGRAQGPLPNGRAQGPLPNGRAQGPPLLSVAENYRRDPMSRLTRALLDAGVIGTPQLYIDASAGSGNQIIITPWRHQKFSGGMLLDGGVHNADMMFYYQGDVHDVFARTALWEKVRYKPQGSGALSGFYDRWQGEMPDQVEATAEDTMLAVLRFKSGTLGQWTQSYAAHGRGSGSRIIYGSHGSLIPGGTRDGVSPALQIDGREELSGDTLLELVPDFHLDTISSALFGADRMASYNLPFPAADRKLLAIEVYELADCILNGKTPEVDGRTGRRAVALCYAAFESSLQNRPVTLDEIETEQLFTYEEEINRQLGLAA